MLKQYQMKLNPPKCIFSVGSDMAVDFMVTSRGNEANPDKFQAIMDAKKSKTVP